MTEQPNSSPERAQSRRAELGSQSTGVPAPDNQAPPEGVAREGEDERMGEGGYGNDTGFATGSVAPRDDEDEAADAGGRSAREQQTTDTYDDPARRSAP
ncbi:MAG: hypothetical protein M3154_10105 [Candidatus Eremiobacteraeota bacterium]|nr:hypothetical protein [Candidatus Eremiobacteraeota bacterium]